jgi:hypothetical protein
MVLIGSLTELCSIFSFNISLRDIFFDSNFIWQQLGLLNFYLLLLVWKNMFQLHNSLLAMPCKILGNYIKSGKHLSRVFYA